MTAASASPDTEGASGGGNSKSTGGHAQARGMCCVVLGPLLILDLSVLLLRHG